MDKKEYYIKNRKKILERNNQWRKDNPKKRKEQIKRYRKKYPKKEKDRQKRYRIKHSEEIKRKEQAYRERNRIKINLRSKIWRKNNPEKVRKYNNKWSKNRRKTNLKYNLNKRMSRSISLSLRNNKNGKHWEDLVEYTSNDLIKRLKKTMPEGYNWSDYMQGKLHIDHIIPISAFNFDCSENPDFKNCWALSNLQLLPAKENLIKSNKLNKPFQPALKIWITY